MKHEARELQKIKSFTDLNAWKSAHRLCLEVYRITKQFPDDEKYGLVSQMRRAAVSMGSNIAEGFSRSSYADKAHFYVTALGSNTELQYQLVVCRDLSYVEALAFNDVAEQSVNVNKLINGLIKRTRSFHAS